MQSHHILKENRFFEHIGATAPPTHKNSQDFLVYSYEIELNSFLPVFCPGNQSKKKLSPNKYFEYDMINEKEENNSFPHV